MASENTEPRVSDDAVAEDATNTDSTLEDATNLPTKKSLEASYVEIRAQKQQELAQQRDQAQQERERELTQNQEDRLTNIEKLELERKLRREQMLREAAEEEKASRKRASIVDTSPSAAAASNAVDANVDQGKRFLLLVSEGFGTHQQHAHQERVRVMLQGQPTDEVDGSDAKNKDRRNELFGISGVRGNYPQLFVIDGATTSFVGTYETVEAMNEGGELKSMVMAAKGEDTVAAEAGSPAGETQTVDASVSGKSFLLLISEGFGQPQQHANQERVLTMLQGLIYTVIDGSDPMNKERRTELFGISGIRGNYPQLFLVHGGTTSFVGTYETVEAMNEGGELKTMMMSTPREDSPAQQQPTEEPQQVKEEPTPTLVVEEPVERVTSQAQAETVPEPSSQSKRGLDILESPDTKEDSASGWWKSKVVQTTGAVGVAAVAVLAAVVLSSQQSSG